MFSTLLEILAHEEDGTYNQKVGAKFQPFLRFWLYVLYDAEDVRLYVSTLLEILGLVCLVVVGF